MILVYQGERTSKTVEVNRHRYVFAPECDVPHEKDAKWLLSTGLFVQGKPGEAAVPPPPPAAEPVPEPQPVTTSRPKKEKAITFKCGECGKVCKTKLALSGHMRSHK